MPSHHQKHLRRFPEGKREKLEVSWSTLGTHALEPSAFCCPESDNGRGLTCVGLGSLYTYLYLLWSLV